MRLRSLSGVVLSSLALASFAVAACGSEDDKKKNNENDYESGGEGGRQASGGESSTPRAGRGGSGNGEAGEGNVQGGTGGTGGSAPTAGTASAGEGGAGGDGNVVPFNGLYIGPDGDDAAAGTVDAPFATLSHAASVAQAGDTIVFLDGDYTVPPGAVTIPDGVDLMAQNAGLAILSGTGPLLNLQGDTRITGLDFENFSTPIQFVGAAEASGTVTIEDTRFDSCSLSCLALSGAAKAVVIGEGDASLANGGGAFAILTETSSLSITEGMLQNFQAGGIIRADDESTVSLTDIYVENGTGAVLILRDKATGIVDGANIAILSAAMFQLYNQTELTVRGSDVSAKAGAPKGNCFLAEGTNKLTIESSKVHGCGTGIKRLPDDLHVIDTEFYDLEFGAEATAGTSSKEGNVLIEGCDFHDISYSALRFGSLDVKVNAKIRDTVIDVSTIANWGALILDGTNASQIDLGTLAEPGGNTFVQRGTTAQHTAVQIALTAVTVYAVGNTWTPGLQGADENGRYAVVSGKVLDDATSASGRNYIKPSTTTTIRLAQNP